MNRYRTHNCGELGAADVGQPVRLSGWVHRKRDHGNLLFIDLRDHFGLTQVVLEKASPHFAAAEGARFESVLRVDGTVIARTRENVNPNLPTGHIEVAVGELEILSAAEVLPFPVNAPQDAPEEQRLRFRFLDLRRERMHKNVVTRSKIIS